MLDATKCFRVSAIRLTAASFETADSLSEISIEQNDCTAQTRRLTSHKFVEREVEAQTNHFLLATVSLGYRLVKGSGEGAEKPEVAYFTVQASFVAEFEVRAKDYDEVSLTHFVEQNATHIVWPFWRQHVYSTLQAASLPAISIPLMAGVSPHPSPLE